MKLKKITAIIFLTILIINIPTVVFAAKKTAAIEKTVTDTINLDWWKDFNDSILFEYIIKALQHNNDLKISSLKTAASKETKNIVRANEMPTMGIGAVPALYKLPMLTNSHGLISLPIYANYELDLYGKNRDKTKSMDKMYEISRLNEKAAYISIICAVGSAYYNVVKLDELILLQEDIITDRKRIYELMELSNNEGLISTSDTISANKAYIRANSELSDLKKTREKLLNSLAVLTGENPNNIEEFQVISYKDININKQIPESISSEIIQKRPDYLAAEKMIEKTGLDVRAAKKEFLPSIDILGLISFNSSDLLLKKMNWTNSFSAIGSGVSLPLFTGGRKIANLKLKKNQYEQAVESYKKTNLTSIQEVNDALCDLKNDTEKYNKTLENLNAEKQDFHYTNLKYNEGIISNLDLLQKREALLVTQKAEIRDNINRIIDQISLYKAVAGQLI